jgi:hypothetical protein
MPHIGARLVVNERGRVLRLQKETMSDLIYVGVLVAFFAASAYYLRCCSIL